MLYILCGHGHGDSGATGHGYQEQERVRALASRMKAMGGNNVTVYRPDLDPYADGVLNSIRVGSSDKVIELHLDSASASACGGHVVVKEGFSPDANDTRLASFISGMFPGRSQTIVGRSNLADVNIAAQRGINYRLLECCFISNYNDITKFNNNIDAVAKGILTAMGIASTPTKKEGWQKRVDKDGNTKWWYQYADGSYPKSCWKKISGEWYYFDKEGWMATGWVNWKNNDWYYCDKSGVMLSNKMFKPEGDSNYYYVNSSGRMVTNTVIKVDGKNYAFLSSGKRAEKMDSDYSISQRIPG